MPEKSSSSSSSSSTAMFKLQDLIRQTHVSLTNMALTDDDVKTLKHSLSELCHELSPGRLSNELQPFYKGMSKLLVNAIENQSYNDKIFSCIWNFIFDEIWHYDDTKNVFVPVAHAAAKMKNTKLLGKTIEILCVEDEDYEEEDRAFIDSLFRDLLNPMILTAQTDIISFLVSRKEYNSLVMFQYNFNSLLALSANLAEQPEHDERLNTISEYLDIDSEHLHERLNMNAQSFLKKCAELTTVYEQWETLLVRIHRLKSQRFAETVSEPHGISEALEKVSEPHGSSEAFDDAYARAEKALQLYKDKGELAIPILARQYRTESELLSERLSKILTAITMLNAQEKQLQDDNFAWLMGCMQTMQQKIERLEGSTQTMQQKIKRLEGQVGELKAEKAENEKLQLQGSSADPSKADKPSALTASNIFSPLPKSSQKRVERENDSEDSYDSDDSDKRFRQQ